MSKRSKPILRDWFDLSTRERSPREKHERGDGTTDVIYLLDPKRIASEMSTEGAIPRNAVYRGLVARIYIAYPRDGMGCLRVLAMVDKGADQGVGYFAADASGCGYDKLAACLDGCPLPTLGDGSVFLGDHCDHAGDPTLDQLCERFGLVKLGG